VWDDMVHGRRCKRHAAQKGGSGRLCLEICYARMGRVELSARSISNLGMCVVLSCMLLVGLRWLLQDVCERLTADFEGEGGGVVSQVDTFKADLVRRSRSWKRKVNLQGSFSGADSMDGSRRS